jgi:hypothetical protein
VHRVLAALLLVPAVVAASSAGRVLHTHAYQGHDHPAHHHGLAAHEHSAMAVHPDEGAPHVKGCDPGEHAVPFAFLCVAGPEPDIEPGDIEPAVLTAFDLQPVRFVRFADVRVHGPPARGSASPRAPPVIPCA